MADINVAQDRGRQLTWLWALLALAAIVGLMLWLASVAEPTQMVTEDDTVVTEGPALGFATLAADPVAYTDSVVAVSDGRVTEVLTSRAVLVQADGMEEPWLVGFGPSVAGVGAPEVGQVYTITGQVGAMNEAVMEEWEEQGLLDELARERAGQAPYFILANQVEEEQAAAADTAAAGAATTQQP